MADENGGGKVVMNDALLLIGHVPGTSKKACARCMLVGRNGSDLSSWRAWVWPAWEERSADHPHGMEERNCCWY